MTSFKENRREFLAAGLTGTVAALAGCTGILADGRGVPGKSDIIEDEDGSGGPSGVPEDVHTYLTDNGANGYEEELEDMTGEDSITIEVGAGGQGFSFAPAAVNIDPGTEVTWEWTGNGGAHNVVSREDSADEFDSGEAVDEEGETFSHTFEEAGNQFYHCEPHTGSGMHGAIVVGEVSDGGGGGGDSDPITAYMEENEVNLWEGEVTDETDADSVTVEVGAGGQGFSFDPPAVSVSASTEVTWEWTGNGGAHNVVSTEAPAEFSSGEAVSEAGTTYSRTFEVGGNHFYHCEPHSSIGMHGVVVVEGGADGSTGGNETGDNETGDGAAGNETGGNETA
ncbi:halocyanin domain-containing protein [Halobacteriaceae bacterium SHR40]|uniref:halocyanin domain-containing protein n=1 Tax=Halovenus amylolytica TaxID=2500550 RepID=UPI000FE428B6